jgi:hypothetical protein
MENNVAALKKSLPKILNTHTGCIPFQAQYTLTPGSNVFNVEAFTNTHAHLLTLTAGRTHYSHLLKEDTASHSLSEAQSYFNVSVTPSTKPPSTTSTTAKPSKTTTKGYSWTKLGYSGVKDAWLLSKPFTMEALDHMVFIHDCPKREFLGAIALATAAAAIAMGIIKWAKIMVLKQELFEVRKMWAVCLRCNTSAKECRRLRLGLKNCTPHSSTR